MINFEELHDIDNSKRIFSKRNSVFLFENGDNLEVIKKFNYKEYYKKELIIYNILQKEYNGKINNSIYKIPLLIDFNDKELFIKYQYISGDTLINSFEHYERENDIEAGIRILNLLFQWINKFQKALTKEENIELLSLINIDLDNRIINEGIEVVSLVDINFRNFITSKNLLYGFDFENVAIEKKVNDYSKSLAYMMLYNPVFSEYKKELLPNLLVKLENLINIPTDDIYKSYIDEVNKIERRRALKTNS